MLENYVWKIDCILYSLNSVLIQFVNQTSSVDMRFASLEMLQKKQERSQSAYVVLSGGQKQSSLNEYVRFY